jgi:hypothetical protein
MSELGKYIRIYYHTTHKKLPELVSYIEDLLNSSVVETTGHALVELLIGKLRPDIFRNLLKNPDQITIEDNLAN